MALFYIFASMVIGFFVFWFLSEVLFTSSFPLPAHLRNKSILLLIGHPDDEAMFFGPSLLALTSAEHHNRVQILCLSTGNAVGQGEIRRGELLDSARRLGVPAKDSVHIIDDPRFQDGPGTDWGKEDIADFLLHRFASPTMNGTYFGQGNPPQTDNSTTSMPDVILTFDALGVSLHPNHSACYAGALHFLHLHQHHLTKVPTLYTLTSLPTWRKYIHVLDALVTLLVATFSTPSPLSSLASKCSSNNENNKSNSNDNTNKPTIFISNFHAYARAFGAMVNAHKTQMLWFRWGWIISGRYMVVNDIRREVIVDDTAGSCGVSEAAGDTPVAIAPITS